MLFASLALMWCAREMPFSTLARCAPWALDAHATEATPTFTARIALDVAQRSIKERSDSTNDTSPFKGWIAELRALAGGATP